MKNNDGAGATKPKTGGNVAPISRPAGYGQAVGAIHNKTRSRYTGSGKHNHYEGTGGYGSNENIKGYGSNG